MPPRSPGTGHSGAFVFVEVVRREQREIERDRHAEGARVNQDGLEGRGSRTAP
jgi:hypothetical protein